MGQLQIERLQKIGRLPTIEPLHRIEPQRVRVRQHLKGQQLRVQLKGHQRIGPLAQDQWDRILLVQVAQAQVAQAQVAQRQAEVVEVEDDINFRIHYLIKKRMPFQMKWHPFFIVFYTSNPLAYQRHSYL